MTNISDEVPPDASDGLTTEEAESRLRADGPNEIEEHATNPVLKFLHYFWGPIPWMIEVAAILSILVHHWPEFIIITVLLLANAACRLLGRIPGRQRNCRIEKHPGLKRQGETGWPMGFHSGP